MRTAAASRFTALVAAELAASGCGFIRNDTLNQAARAGDEKRTVELLAQGADVNGRGMHAMKPLMSAAQGGQVGIEELLIARRADMNSHNDGGSVLMWAAGTANGELVGILLQHGVDFRWTNALGNTALEIALEQHRTNIVRLL